MTIPRQPTRTVRDGMPYAATLQHCELLRAKIDALTARLADASAQLYTCADREYRDGNIALDDLAALYERARSFGGVGFSTVWGEHMSVKAALIRQYLQATPPNVTGTPAWSGAYPYESGVPRPPKGVAVVYVLYDVTLEPIYLGSSAHFAARMRTHRRTKPVRWWLAYPCATREAAYLLEEGLLTTRKPAMNVKTSR